MTDIEKTLEAGLADLSDMVAEIAPWQFIDCRELTEDTVVCHTCRLHRFCQLHRHLNALTWQIRQSDGV